MTDSNSKAGNDSEEDKKLGTLGNGHLLMANNSSDSSEGMYRAIADPTLQRRPAAAGELYIPVELTIFAIFFYAVPLHKCLFYYFYRFSRHTRTYCKNLRVKIINFEVFTGL